MFFYVGLKVQDVALLLLDLRRTLLQRPIWIPIQSRIFTDEVEVGPVTERFGA